MNQKGFVNIVLIAAVAVAIGLTGYFILVKNSKPVSWEYWRTSKDHFIVKIPSDWKISQADAEEISIVSISSPENSGADPNLSVYIEDEISIKYSLNDPEKDILEMIINTLNFKPTQAQLQSAAIIP